MNSGNFYRNFLHGKGVIVFILLNCFVFSLRAATYYTRQNGNWNSPLTWSTVACGGVSAGGFPGVGDDIVVCSGHTLNLTASHDVANLTINSGGTLDCNGQTLRVSGDWTNNLGGIFIEGTGTIEFNSTSGNQNIYTPAGGETFYDLTINNTFGTVTANGNVTITSGRTLTITAGIFDMGTNTLGQTGAANLTMSAGGLNLAKLGTTLPELTGTYNITGGTVTFNGAGAQTIRSLNAVPSAYYHVVLGGSGTKTLAASITVQGDWTNNGTTLSGGGSTVTFTGTLNTISGTSSSDFPVTVIASGANYTMTNSNSCTDLTFNASSSASSFTHSASTLTVSGNVTMNQPGAAVTTSWNINDGTSTIAGTLAFVGGSAVAGRISEIVVTTGSLTASGAVNFASNTADANQVIKVTGSGSVSFASSVVTTAQADLRDGTLAVGPGNGTITFSNKLAMTGGAVSVSSTGTLNFNNADAFSFNTGSIPAFATNFGSTLNFNGHVTTGTALTFADGSYSFFTGNATVTPVSLVFGYLQINAGVTMTLAGNISVANDWTNLGTFTPGTNTVTFNGTGTQTITKAGGETFYNLTTNCTGPLTLANDVTVNNQITMTAGNYNLNGNTMTLGNAAVSTLSRAAGIMYGGTFKRWWPTVAITSADYGLFPVGSSTDYRPVAINSTANPTTAGYVLCRHYDAISVTNLAYVDNEGASIQRKHDMYDAMSISGLAGGTYNIDVLFSGLSPVGVLADMKLITYTGGVPGSVGTSAATTGSASSPTVKRTVLTAANLQNDWVIGTKDKSATPLRPPYFSRKTGNWNDATVGNATWSLFPQVPGPQPSCDCLPTTDALVYISNSDVVSVTAAATCDYVIVEDAATLNGTANMTVNVDLTTLVSGKIAPTSGTWTITRNLTLGSSSVSSSSSSAMTVTGNLTIPSGASLTQAAALTVSGNLVVDGTLAATVNNIALNGTAKNISGTGFINGIGTITITNGKSILSGTNLTIKPILAISGAATVTNNGIVILQNNLTGTVAGSTWTNAANSTLYITGSLLATGTLNASASPNTVDYNGAGAQTVKTPSGGIYYNLTSSTSGIKTANGNLSITNNLTIQNAATFYDNSLAITGAGSLTMSGTSVYLIRNNSATVPALGGSYNLTGGTINFNRGGNQTVRSIGLNGPAPAAYYNATFSNTNTKTLAGPITVQNDLSIIASSQLDASGSNYAVNLKGNWIVTSTNGNPFVERSGTVTLSGAAQQNISTVLAAGETFYNLTVNNSTPASAVLLTNNATVSNTLNLTDGHILTTPVGSGLLTMGANASVALNSVPFQDSSFVKGKLACIISGNISYTKIFPIGKDNDYRMVQLTIDHQPNATVTYTAEMKNSSARTLGYTVPGTLASVSDMRYFEIISSAPTTNLDNAIVYLNYQCTQIGDYVQDLPNLKIAQWDGASAWVDIGGLAAGGICSGLNYAGDVFSNNFSINEFTGYRFALANSSVGANPLPVELLSFDAKPNGNIIDVKWETSSELNSDYFMVERSKDGITFEDVEKVEAAGNSTTTKKYYTSDYEPYSGVSYYRLKQVDNDGQFKYSNIIAVKFLSDDVMAVYPNPTSGPFNVSVKVNPGDEVLIVVRDLLGQEFYSKVIIAVNDKEVIAVDPSGKLAAGVYIVVASSNDNIYEKKIVIK